MNDKLTSEAPPDPPVANTLEEYLRLRESKAEAFVALLKSDKAKIGAVELRLGAEAAKDVPNAAVRVADLVRASRSMPGPARRQILLFGRKIVQDRAAQLRLWAQDNDKTGLQEVEELLSWTKPLLASSSKEMKAEAEAVISIGLAFLLESRELDPLTLIERVGDAYAIQRPSDNTDTRLKTQLVSTLARSRPKQIAQLAQVARLQEQAVSESRDLLSSERRRTALLNDRVIALSNQIEVLQAQLNSRDSELAEAIRQSELSARHLESAERVGAHDMGDLKARYRRILGSDLKAILSDAIDALELAPPRPDFARRFLEDLALKIEGEVRWINARSD